MMMGPRATKVALAAHVMSSVGWFGAIAAFLAVAVAGLASGDAMTVRAAYVSMDIMAWYAIVPLCFATLTTGILQSLGTPWGLFRHYWIIAKLLITGVSTAILLLHMQPIGHLAQAVAEAALAEGELHGMRIQMVATSAAAMAALGVATVLSLVKPRGVTPYGWRKQQEGRG